MSRNIQVTGATENDYPTSASRFRWGVLRAHRPAVSALSLFMLLAIGPALAQEGPSDIGVDWSGIFNADGSARDDFAAPGTPGANGTPDAIDVYGGLDAVFIEDRVSGGAVIDISALERAPSLEGFFVHNSSVPVPDDLGNAYVFARLDEAERVIDVRVERLLGGAATSASFIEIELNQGAINTRAGKRWPSAPLVRWSIDGRRSVGDLLVRVNLVGEKVSSIEFKNWADVGEGPTYQPLLTIDNPAADACVGLGTDYAFCGGLLEPGGGVANGDPEQLYEPDSYLEFSVNLGQLFGANPDYTSIQVCSAQDVAFGTFKAFGLHAGN